MRHPKAPPPLPTAIPSLPSTEPKYDETASILMIEKVLVNALDPGQTITPDTLCDLMEMFITDLHLRKVTGEVWCEVEALCVDMIKLAASVSSESGLRSLPDLTAETTKILDGSIELSLQSIRELRVKLYSRLNLLMQCPMPGVTIH